jgi:hypothetical protein
MRKCVKCGNNVPATTVIDGRRRNLCNRQYCLTCSPFRKHNTSILESPRYSCTCGETDPKKFYGNKNRICAKCHNIYTQDRGKGTKLFVVTQLGSKCNLCGFNKYISALEVHHLDPCKKDAKFRGMRGWSKARVLSEIKDCILLCSNCHHAIHNGEVSISGSYDIGQSV